ncbi:uncharacterized protein EMH_0005580 [Eimeria mitis]|uniref:Uncharacterized protein n=1 Tax=Eimeria mitis TaxID=44415 RepID=U6KC44_9EIME|nr:uncharacterized protein EMH_0005580 [Eimeria mitis]CDJ35595.1 hypothetical protein, conserved [Eimeria mitis]
MNPRRGPPTVLRSPAAAGCPFPSARYQRPLSLSELPTPEAEGPRAFWWVGNGDVEGKEVLLKSSGHGEQLPRQRRKKRNAAQKKREQRELPVDEQQQQDQQYRSSVKLQLQRAQNTEGEGYSTEEPDEETLKRLQGQHLQQQQHRRHRNSLHMQVHRESGAYAGNSASDSSDEEVQGQQQAQAERQRRNRYRNSVHLQVQRNLWRSKVHTIPEESDEESQETQPEAPESGKQQRREKTGAHSEGVQEAGELSESDWSDREFSDDEGPADSATQAAVRFKGQISPENLEGSPLPASVIKRAVAKINRRYEQCGDTAREMTVAEEELIDSVIRRWESSGFQAFEIEGMTVDSQEQQIILQNEALTPNLINIYLRALEINKTPLTTSKRRRPKQTSLPVEVASKLLSPSLSEEDGEQLLVAMEARRVLDAHITVFPLMESRMHYSALVVDTIKGNNSVLFLLRWFDPFGESGTTPLRNILPLLKRLADMHVAAEGDALYFRKQMLLKLDFAGRWKRVTASGRE